MKKEIFTEDFETLNEFIQKVSDIVSPMSFRDELRAVMNKDSRKQLYEKYPKCWMPIRLGNTDHMILPVCNRSGATSKEMIAFSMKLANKLAGREDVDRGMLEITLKKLKRMHNTYSRDIPSPPNRVAQRANITKAMTVLKRQLNSIRGEDKEGEIVPQRVPISVP